MIFRDETFPEGDIIEPEGFQPFDMTPFLEEHPATPNSFLYYYEKLTLWEGEGTNEIAGNSFETIGYIRTVKAA